MNWFSLSRFVKHFGGNDRSASDTNILVTSGVSIEIDGPFYLLSWVAERRDLLLLSENIIT